MPGLNDPFIDLVREFRGEQADVVFERLVGVTEIVKSAVPKHRAQGVVVIGEFMQAVVVAVQIEANRPADKNRPERHAGAASGLADLRCDPAFQQFEYRGAQRNIGVEELQASENLWDVIA
jgi:hypothetical protein